MKNALREKVQTLATQTWELLEKAKELDSMLDSHLDDDRAENEIAVITRRVNELEHAERLKSPHLQTLQYVKKVRENLLALIETTEARWTRTNLASTYRKSNYSGAALWFDNLIHQADTWRLDKLTKDLYKTIAARHLSTWIKSQPTSLLSPHYVNIWPILSYTTLIF